MFIREQGEAMLLKPSAVGNLLDARLPFSSRVSSKEKDAFASEITELVNRGDTADYIALHLSRIHTNKLEQAFAGTAYLEIATELVRLTHGNRDLKAESTLPM
jgi:hypothetical protein